MRGSKIQHTTATIIRITRSNPIHPCSDRLVLPGDEALQLLLLPEV